MTFQTYDVAIVGGGAAGLSAALVVARARRRVIVLDAGSPRNAAAAHMHNSLSRDGMPPAELLAVGIRKGAADPRFQALSSCRTRAPRRHPYLAAVLLPYVIRRSSSALDTTVMLEADIASAPNSGRSIMPSDG